MTLFYKTAGIRKKWKCDMHTYRRTEEWTDVKSEIVISMNFIIRTLYISCTSKMLLSIFSCKHIIKSFCYLWWPPWAVKCFAIECIANAICCQNWLKVIMFRVTSRKFISLQILFEWVTNDEFVIQTISLHKISTFGMFKCQFCCLSPYR